MLFLRPIAMIEGAWGLKIPRYQEGTFADLGGSSLTPLPVAKTSIQQKAANLWYLI